MTLNISLLVVIYDACTCTPLYVSVHKILSASFTDSKDMAGSKILKMDHVTMSTKG